MTFDLASIDFYYGTISISFNVQTRATCVVIIPAVVDNVFVAKSTLMLGPTKG